MRARKNVSDHVAMKMCDELHGNAKAAKKNNEIFHGTELELTFMVYGPV